MDDKVNYTLVGAFVLLLGAVLVLGVLWLSAGLGGKQAMDSYQAVIEESVAGLNVDAPLKYLGVDVGKVSQIAIDQANPGQVRLHFLVQRGTPIKQDSVAALKTQGLTGIAYVELSGGSAGALPLLPGPDGVAPTIPFKLSLSARMESVLSNVLSNVDRVSDNLNAVFDADNRAALKAALADVAALTHGLAAEQATIHAALRDAARTAQVSAKAADQVGPTLDRLARGAQAVEQMAVVAQEASGRAGRAADAAASSVQQVGTQTLPDLSRLMRELEALSASLRRLSEQTTANPGSLLTGTAPPRPGPGEGTGP
jgi:phospholipid/cholesterol/gamma-HCH transport system substrate-binding protein